MSVADPGRLTQSVIDAHICVGMDLSEWVIETTGAVERALADIPPSPEKDT